MTSSSTDTPHLLLCGAYSQADMDALAARYVVHRWWEVEDRADFLATYARRIGAIATRGDLGASGELIAALPALEIIACFGVGVDAIDLGAARQRGIHVTTTPDVLTGDVADLALGLALGLLRQIPAGDAHVRSGAWERGPLGLARRLHGKRIGLVGLGRVGSAVARRFGGFDGEIGYFDLAARADSAHRFFPVLAELAAWSDVLILTAAGGDSTRGLVDAQVLRALGTEGYLVNVSRGSIVHEPDLLQALESRAIAGAALDVFWNEPMIDARFRALDNVLLQPHAASGTVETRAAMGQLVRDNLEAHFAGRSLLTPLI